MNKLSDFKEEINRCSKCGLCQTVCPVFKVTANDCAVSKGKFVMLDGVLKGKLKLNKNINKYLDMCLKCGKCEEFCPSSIKVCKIFETAKYEYAKNTFWGNFIFFLESKFIFGNFLKIFKRKSHIKKDQGLKLIYFKGCVNNIFPQKNSILNKIPDIEIIEKDFDCCGQPFLSSGNLERFNEVKNHNLSLLDCDFDYILTDCASCESTLKKYVDAKFINLGELLVKKDVKFKFEKPIKVTFHKPCHLENDFFIEPLLKSCKNVEYIKMDNYDDCCGFAGEFAIKNPKISNEIAKNKAANIINTKADYVITVCPACIIGLKKGLIGIKNAPKVLSLSEFLALSKFCK